MDPLLGEAMAVARAMEIALLRQWSKVILRQTQNFYGRT